MDAPEKQRLVAWWRESFQNTRKGKWWLVLVPIVLWLLSGLAALMLQELDLSDLSTSGGGASYEINMAVFVRMEVASLDRPRTVTQFEIEMIAPDQTNCSSRSEYGLDVKAIDDSHEYAIAV
jgi:hypothetical protein